ncbi:efflux transporter outer membrane subunit [Paraglaciecola polaris]|uniref:efflux transporter outer membrane subunit n=1 Tax=Paraglaciecola polaris TaxID=222814 RepID=UPI0030EC9961|tara:strand:+ start:41425 stop:42984 length:1560 start_codon:yes stop_codon:yes gene_type:complete
MRNNTHNTATASRMLKKIGIAVGIALLTGCTVGPNFTSPSATATQIDLAARDDYSHQYPVSNADISSQWWTLFNDPILSNLEARARLANLDLKIMASRVEQSRANLGITSSNYLPKVSTSGSYTREDISDNSKFAALGAKSSGNDYWQAGFDASWEIDLWGHIKRTVEGAQAEFEVTVLAREAYQITLAAEVARNYLQFRGIQAQLRITEQNKQIAEHKLTLVKSTTENGLTSKFETSMASAQLAAVTAQIPKLVERRNTQMNKLALLLGENPRALDEELINDVPLPSLPKTIPVGIPAQLAHKRPDVLKAEAQLHQATAAIGVAQSNFYPRITLVGRSGFEAFQSSDLASWDSSFFSVGPAVYLPIFQGGELKQRLKLTEAKQKSAALAYRQTVLNAWHEVDNALDGLASQRSQFDHLNDAYESYKIALHFAQRNYQEGAGNYLNVLTAQRNVLDSRMALNDSATNATLSLVTLYKALGGGWGVSNNDPTAPVFAATDAATISRPNSAAAMSEVRDGK